MNTETTTPIERKNIQIEIEHQEYPELETEDVWEEILPEHSAKNIQSLYQQTKATKQTCITEYMNPYISSSEDHSYGKIYELEHENNLLKIEIREMKDRMSNLEIMIMNAISSPSFQPKDTSSMSCNIYDRLSTKIKDLEYEVKKVKDTCEMLEADQLRHDDHITLIQQTLDDMKEDQTRHDNDIILLQSTFNN